MKDGLLLTDLGVFGVREGGGMEEGAWRRSRWKRRGGNEEEGEKKDIYGKKEADRKRVQIAFIQ